MAGITVVVLSRWFHPTWTHGASSYTLGLVKSLIKLRKQTKIVRDIIVISSLSRRAFSRSHADELEIFREVCSEIKTYYIEVPHALRVFSTNILTLKSLTSLSRSLSTSTGSKSIWHIVAFGPTELLYVTDAIRRNNRHCICIPHIIFTPALRSLEILRLLSYRLMIRMNNVLPTTSSETLRSIYFGDRYSTLVIPPAIDTSLFRKHDVNALLERVSKDIRILVQNSLTCYNYVMLYLGGLTKLRMWLYKTLLRAIANMSRDIKDIGLIIVARPEQVEITVERALNELVERLGIKRRVVILRKLLSLYEKILLFSITDVFIYLPAVKNLTPVIVDPPITVLEAMSCECAILATPFYSLTKVIEPGRDGFIIHRTDVDSIRNYLTIILSSNRYMGRNARDKVLRDYSIDSVVARLSSLYKYLCEN